MKKFQKLSKKFKFKNCTEISQIRLRPSISKPLHKNISSHLTLPHLLFSISLFTTFHKHIILNLHSTKIKHLYIFTNTYQSEACFSSRAQTSYCNNDLSFRFNALSFLHIHLPHLNQMLDFLLYASFSSTPSN